VIGVMSRGSGREMVIKCLIDILIFALILPFLIYVFLRLLGAEDAVIATLLTIYVLFAIGFLIFHNVPISLGGRCES
jgi:hypothetical protein